MCECGVAPQGCHSGPHSTPCISALLPTSPPIPSALAIPHQDPHVSQLPSHTHITHPFVCLQRECDARTARGPHADHRPAHRVRHLLHHLQLRAGLEVRGAASTGLHCRAAWGACAAPPGAQGLVLQLPGPTPCPCTCCLLLCPGAARAHRCRAALWGCALTGIVCLRTCSQVAYEESQKYKEGKYILEKVRCSSRRKCGGEKAGPEGSFTGACALAWLPTCVHLLQYPTPCPPPCPFTPAGQGAEGRILLSGALPRAGSVAGAMPAPASQAARPPVHIVASAPLPAGVHQPLFWQAGRPQAAPETLLKTRPSPMRAPRISTSHTLTLCCHLPRQPPMPASLRLFNLSPVYTKPSLVVLLP